MHVPSLLSCPEDGRRGFTRFQKSPGVVVLAEESKKNRLIDIRLSLVTKFLCTL